ncbi:hypothetical protein HK102_012446 [Quaeritorhiza haematococci]|nr:hypothetical protein HK102_012446 [Quaeritorhiza haematococci]
MVFDVFVKYLVSNNIGQIAYLNAQAHGIQRIYFSGFFIRGHPITMNTLSYAINFWSKGRIKALFLRHEGYLGAMGAFLRHHHRYKPPLSAEPSSFNHVTSPFGTTPTSAGPPTTRSRKASHSRSSFTENFAVPIEQLTKDHSSALSAVAVGVLDTTPTQLSSLLQLVIKQHRQHRKAQQHESLQQRLSQMQVHEEEDVGEEREYCYNPDTSDLSDNPMLQKYWIDLLDKNLGALVELALQWQGRNEDSKQRAATFEAMYRDHLHRLRKEPHAYGVLTVRSLLNLREQCLREMGFVDIFKGIKQIENDAAAKTLPGLLKRLDAIWSPQSSSPAHSPVASSSSSSSPSLLSAALSMEAAGATASHEEKAKSKERESALIDMLVENILADYFRRTDTFTLYHFMIPQQQEICTIGGKSSCVKPAVVSYVAFLWSTGLNLFSRLARSTSVQEMLKKGELDFETAKAKVGHPAEFDLRARLKERLLNDPRGPHHKAVIFVDNSGADIILGILPFARYLLQRGTHVVLAANTDPAVNDITAEELTKVMNTTICNLDETLRNAWNDKRLQVIGTGSGSPCLDLTRISDDLVIEAADADFVILEGMGRAIHTNFRARFTVESLKIGVFKNPQVAQELGASMGISHFAGLMDYAILYLYVGIFILTIPYLLYIIRGIDDSFYIRREITFTLSICYPIFTVYMLAVFVFPFTLRPITMGPNIYLVVLVLL